MKKHALFLCFILAIALCFVACGRKKEGIEPTANPKPTSTAAPITEPEVTVMPEATEAPKVTETPEPTTVPEATEAPEPTATPELTVAPEPTATPELTVAPEPTATPEPTVTPEPTATPEPTVAPEPTATPELTATPEPTATPKPTTTPIPTPKPGAEVTVRFYTPMILPNLNAIQATDAIEFLSKMTAYEMPKNGMATETAMLDETAGTFFKAVEEKLLKDGAVYESAKDIYGDDVVITATGWYDNNKTHEVFLYTPAGKVPVVREVFYNNSSTKTFLEYDAQKGEELEVYASYSVNVGGKTKMYSPCALEVQLQMGFITTKMSYVMCLPILERIILPEVDGYELKWVDNGMTISDEKIKIYDGMINKYTLLVTPK